MDLLKMNLFKGGIFKQIKFLVSTPQNAQKVVYISEAGTVSQELLPMHTGWASSDIKKAWLVMHGVKFTVCKDGEPAQDEQVLLISERSYIPLDPNNTLNPKAKEKLTSLKDIARLRYAEACAEAEDQNEKADLAYTIIVGCFVLLGMMLLVHLIRG